MSYFPALELERVWDRLARRMGWLVPDAGKVLPREWYVNGLEYARRHGALAEAPDEVRELERLLHGEPAGLPSRCCVMEDRLVTVQFRVSGADDNEAETLVREGVCVRLSHLTRVCQSGAPFVVVPALSPDEELRQCIAEARQLTRTGGAA